MTKATIDTVINLSFAAGGTALLWAATDWKIAIGALLLAIYARANA
jgi:hypothetical protein